MELFDNLALGFSVALTWQNLLFCMIGVLIGTLIGVLPGIGPVATIAMLLPITFYAPPIAAIIMLAGIYYGAQYGGSTTSILVNMPGEASAVVTCLDGYPMARMGRAGAALTVAAVGSLFAGIVGTLALAFFTSPLLAVANSFGSPEYCSLMALGLAASVVLAQGSILKATMMIFVGMLLGLVGTDVQSATLRYTFGLPELSDGIGFVSVAMGLFGMSEIILNLERRLRQQGVIAKIGSLFPSREEWRRAIPASARGTGLGALLGVLPGGGAVMSSFASYALEKRVSKTPERFGNGAIEGVAGPEAANNAGAQTSFIPLLILGIPSNAVLALLAGAMMIHGVAPGPQIASSKPELFWGVIASMFMGNVMLVIINLPLIGLWVRLLKIPYGILFPAILFFCCVGVYTLNNSWFDVLATAFFGILGYMFRKLGCEMAPLLMAYVLAPLFEENLRRSMLLSRGDAMVFIDRPVSAGLIAATIILILIVILPNFRKTREVAFKE
ncbi:MAG: tripartite tricarboxylate transporter permease [Alphaproteobacteria bacterium]|nr:tripartite tricarboxylate transporter permease [Alphaproteobacteria bacterium]